MQKMFILDIIFHHFVMLKYIYVEKIQYLTYYKYTQIQTDIIFLAK